MKANFKSLAVLIALLFMVSANAATITYDKRTINAGVNKNDYRASWASQTSTINSQSLSDFTNRLGGNNTFSRLSVSFSTDNLAKMAFQLAVDAGYGGAVYLNNVLLSRKTNDLWWANNWNNTSQILIGTASNLNRGNHLLEVFWAEGCCNGANSGRFSVNGGGWQSLNLTALSSLKPVPVPAAVWLFGSGLIGLVGVRRKIIK